MLHEIFINYRDEVQRSAFALLAIYAWAKGSGPEKLATGTFVTAIVADMLYHFLLPEGSVYSEINLGHFVIDTATLLPLTFLVVRANRIYPIWLLAAQLIMFVMHIHREIFSEIDPLSYYVLTRAPSWIQLVALTAGISAHHHRARRFPHYLSWKTSSPRW